MWDQDAAANDSDMASIFSNAVAGDAVPAAADSGGAGAISHGLIGGGAAAAMTQLFGGFCEAEEPVKPWKLDPSWSEEGRQGHRDMQEDYERSKRLDPGFGAPRPGEGGPGPEDAFEAEQNRRDIDDYMKRRAAALQAKANHPPPE